MRDILARFLEKALTPNWRIQTFGEPSAKIPRASADIVFAPIASANLPPRFRELTTNNQHLK
jgi:hypothetical protein